MRRSNCTSAQSGEEKTGPERTDGRRDLREEGVGEDEEGHGHILAIEIGILYRVISWVFFLREKVAQLHD